MRNDECSIAPRAVRYPQKFDSDGSYDLRSAGLQE
jgi:hypothetical protein